MPDNWGFVAAAYGLTAAVLLIYWRRLGMKERQLDALTRSNATRSRERLTGERSGLNAERSQERLNEERSQEPSSSGHPRSEPDSRHPLQ